MAAGFNYFKSTDAGAPVLTGVAGSLIPVVEWLTVGKGGYTKPFVGANLAVFRSDSGNRPFLRIDDTQARYSRLRAYRNMTAISTGTGQFPTTSQAVNLNTWGLVKRFAADSNPIRYWGIRTNRYIVMILEYGIHAVEGANYRELFIFGDVPSLCEADAYNSILQGTYNIDTGYPDLLAQMSGTFAPNGATGQSQAAISGSPDGSVVSPFFTLAAPFGAFSDVGMEATVGKSGRLHFSPIQALSKNTVDGSDPGSYPRCRIPNLHQVWGPVRAVANLNIPIIDLEEFTLAGRTYKCFMRYSNDPPVDSYSVDALLLEITDTDGAL